MTSEEKMRELIEELWESDAASALTNRAARALESVLHSVEAEKEPEWISVEDRFPEEGEWVIAATYLLEPISGRKTPIAKELFFDGVTESGVACWLADGDWPNPVSDWRKFPALPEHKPE